MKLFVKKHREVITYLAYGVGTTAVNLVLYTLLVPLLGITASNAVAWFGAVVFAFVTNKLFVFESKSWDWKTTAKEAVTFLGSRVASGAIEIILPTLLFYVGLDHDLFGIEGFLAKIIVSIIVIILNYFLSKLIVFRKTQEAQQEPEASDPQG